MSAPGRQRLDQLLVDRGFCTSAREAAALLMSGQVTVDGNAAPKAGTMLRDTVDIRVRGRSLRFASRGGYKLEKALARFAIDVTGRVALDAGAAGGGFTDCLLQRGARRVYAVDVGYGQLKGRLAADPRVVNLERTNIGDLTPAMFPEAPTFCCADLSYLSLLKALPLLTPLLAEPWDAVCLVKPLFEGLPQGQIADVPELAEVLSRFLGDAHSLGFPARGVTVSPILGTRESVEFLAWFDSSAESAEGLANAAIDELMSHPPGSPDLI